MKRRRHKKRANDYIRSQRRLLVFIAGHHKRRGQTATRRVLYCAALGVKIPRSLRGML